MPSDGAEPYEFSVVSLTVTLNDMDLLPIQRLGSILLTFVVLGPFFYAPSFTANVNAACQTIVTPWESTLTLRLGLLPRNLSLTDLTNMFLPPLHPSRR